MLILRLFVHLVLSFILHSIHSSFILRSLVFLHSSFVTRK